MKAKPTLYRGIEFVHIQDLPSDQQKLLKSSSNRPEFVKILIRGKVSEHCVLYTAYLNWFSTVFKEVTTVNPKLSKNNSGNEALVHSQK